MENSTYWFLILAIVVACISWTVTKEEVFREPREWCVARSKSGATIWKRKFFYLFTCEYCFSHYVTLLLILVTQYKLLYTDWIGYFIAGFTIVWIANVYMGLYSLLRTELKNKQLLKKKLKSGTREEQPPLV